MDKETAVNREKVKNFLSRRYASFPGMPIPGELLNEAMSYIPERLAGKFSVLYVQSPADWERVSGDIGTAIEEWNAGKRSEGKLRFVKVILDTCI
ncbi:MAG: hypothetical protein IH874_06615 [Candidatus Dadabacteria bacterium]|nr:hypothetical protein [Candidatus Dadabacteria bacterium]